MEILGRYDALHRNTSIAYTLGGGVASTPARYFIYDGASVNGTAMAKPKGQLVEAYTWNGGKETDLYFSYSPRGEVTDTYESTPHSNGYYHLSASY